MLAEYGKRARVYELHGDLLFAGVESVLREITGRAVDLDVVVLDVRGVDDVAGVARRMLLELRDEFLAVGGEAVLVDPRFTLVPRDAGDRRVRRFADLNTAVEYTEDALIARYGVPGVTAGRIEIDRHPVLTALPPAARADVAARIDIREIPHGETLVRVGDEPVGIFLILDGLVDVAVPVVRDSQLVRHHVSMFPVGTTFGVVYAIARRPYDVEAVAVGTVRIGVLDMAALDELWSAQPEVMLALLRVLVSASFDNLTWIARTLASAE